MKRFFFVALIVTIVFLPLAVSAGKITFVSPANLPPKIFIEKSRIKGTYVDIIKAVCQRIGVEPVFQLYPWQRCVRMVKTGEADAIFPPFLTEERTQYLYFPSEAVSLTRNVIFARKGSNIKAKSLEDLKGLLVGVNVGYSYGSKFDDFKNFLNIDYSKDEEMQVKKLAIKSRQRMDVAVASEEPFRFLSKKLGFSHNFEIIYVLSAKKSYVAFSKAQGERTRLLAEQFNHALRQLKEDGTVQRIENNYLY